MSFSVKLLKAVNKIFPLPVHPFNTQASGGMTYAEWQYSKGEDTIKFYLEYTDKEKMFGGKDVLDVGCGAGGKSLYYLGCGANKVVGIDIVPKYKEESEGLAEKLGLIGFEFFCEDAGETSFDDNSFDTIIMNDAMEHVAKPEAVLAEMYRILKPGGRLFVNFPPYNHPYGAHLSDVIGIPWVQVPFSDKTLIAAYKDLVADKPDGEDRINFRIGRNEKGEEYFSYINKMSIKRFKKIRDGSDFKVSYYREVPLRSFFKPLCHGFLKEYFVKMVVCVFEK
ncbi:MAG: class I SAM-dependent methyltransferase [Clostridia bacterium]|nr:class I SAM-dependent methyltransferase [Clostridia bacterium]